MLDPHHAVCVGSFDPITLGHFDILQRGAKLYDKLTVGIGINPEKSPLFTPQERLELVRKVLAPFPNVAVACFEGLAVDFVQRCGARVMLRGIRTLTDMDAELTMSLANHVLAPDIEMVFLMASEKHSHISSSLIKQVALLGAGSLKEPLGAFVPHEVIAPLREKFAPRRDAAR
jgi:pantetheine-phosphate adenylyltransferase